MRKVLFLMFLLLLMGLGAAGVKAQVRIGGNGAPNAAAVLDLNVDDSDAGNKGALALPRVSLVNATAPLNGTTPLKGMLIYNTGGTLGAGVYYWDGAKWLILSGAGTTTITKSFDASVSVPAIPANSWIFVTTVGVAYDDFCSIATTAGVVLRAGTDNIAVGNLAMASTGAFTGRIVCFRVTA